MRGYVLLLLLLVTSVHAIDQKELKTPENITLKNEQYDIITEDMLHYENTSIPEPDITNESTVLKTPPEEKTRITLPVSIIIQEKTETKPKSSTGWYVMTGVFVFGAIILFLVQILASKITGKT